MKEHKFSVGQTAKYTNDDYVPQLNPGQLVKIVRIDRSDDSMPYQIIIVGEENETYWAREEELQAVELFGGSDKDSVRSWLKELTAGERQFVSNHLFKHYGVFPQKLRQYVPAEVKLVPAGTAIRVLSEIPALPKGTITLIQRVSTDDTVAPYYVIDPNYPDDADAGYWLSEYEFERVTD
jgi:hypothetical protein